MKTFTSTSSVVCELYEKILEAAKKDKYITYELEMDYDFSEIATEKIEDLIEKLDFGQIEESVFEEKIKTIIVREANTER